MVLDPLQVDANFQVKNLPTPSGGNALWNQQTFTLSQHTEYQDLSVDLSGNRPVHLILNSPRPGLTDGFAVVGGLDAGSVSGPDVPVVLITNFGDGVIALTIEDPRSVSTNRFQRVLRTDSFPIGNNDLGIAFSAIAFVIASPAVWTRTGTLHAIAPGQVIYSAQTQPCTVITNVTNAPSLQTLDTNRPATVGSGSSTLRIMPTLFLYGGQQAFCVYDTVQGNWKFGIDGSVVRYCRNLQTFFPTPKAGDMLVYNGWGWEPLPIGVDGTVLTADSTKRIGVAWT